MLPRALCFLNIQASKVYLSGSDIYSFVHVIINPLPFPSQIILAVRA